MASGVGDRLVGMNLSRATTLALDNAETLHVGRVQTPTLALPVERERAIRFLDPKTPRGGSRSCDIAGRGAEARPWTGATSLSILISGAVLNANPRRRQGAARGKPEAPVLSKGGFRGPDPQGHRA